MSLKQLFSQMQKKREGAGILNNLNSYLTDRETTSNEFPEEREDGYAVAYHPSSLSSVSCLRALTYRMIRTPKSNDTNNAKGQRIFDNGHAVGHNIQGYLYQMGVLLGKWECVYCGETWEDLDNPSPKTCPSCKQSFVGYVAGEGRWHDIIYREVAVVGHSPSGVRKILGHADGIVLVDDGQGGKKKVFIEIKSIKTRDRRTSPKTVCFEELNAPLPPHLYQLNLYLEYNSLGIVEGIVIYWNKNTQDWKEFPIKKIPFYVEELKRRMVTTDESIEKKILPERKCGKKGDEPYCPYKDFCFTEHSFEDADKRSTYKGVDNNAATN